MRIGRALTAVVCGALAVAVAPAAARAERGLLVGVSENGLKYEAPRTAAGVDELGARGVRITVAWDPAESVLAGEERQWLDRAVAAAGPGVRIVLAAYGPSASAPDTDAERGRYCSYVGSALARYARIHDVVVWNEPNKSGFWRQQYDGAGRSVAPAMYEALVAHCYDVLHGIRADVNVLTSTSSRGNDDPNARSNVSHSPGTFIRGMGEAYRASGRTKPIFDTVGHHPYGEHSAERPWRRHPLSSTIGEGDWDKLVQAYHDAFARTLQPNPGRCVAGRCAPIWYMEVGYQTTLEPSKAGFYRGRENAETTVPAAGPGEPPGSRPDERSPAPDHGTQLADGIRLAYCQPYVAAYFNFLLQDEQDLEGWQSGVLWADGTRKGSYSAFAKAVADVNAGNVDCPRYEALVLAAAPQRLAPAGSPATGAGAAPVAFPAPRTDVALLSVVWPTGRRFNWRNALWRFRLNAAEDATVTAVLRRVGPRRRRLSGVRTSGFAVRVPVRLGYLTWLTFPRRRLASGRYRFEALITSKASASRTVKLVSPTFTVLRRPKKR